MNDGTVFRRDNNKTTFIKSFKRHKIVESYDHLHPEGTSYIEAESFIVYL